MRCVRTNRQSNCGIPNLQNLPTRPRRETYFALMDVLFRVRQYRTIGTNRESSNIKFVPIVQYWTPNHHRHTRVHCQTAQRIQVSARGMNCMRAPKAEFVSCQRQFRENQQFNFTFRGEGANMHMASNIPRNVAGHRLRLRRRNDKAHADKIARQTQSSPAAYDNSAPRTASTTVLSRNGLRTNPRTCGALRVCFTISSL